MKNHLLVALFLMLGLSACGGGGGGGGGAPPDQGSSIIVVPPTVIMPSLPPTNPGVLPAVPEPQTWAMLLAGLALVGYSTLRRRVARPA